MVYVIVACCAAVAGFYVGWKLRQQYDYEEVAEHKARADSWERNAAMWRAKADEYKAALDVAGMSEDDKARLLGARVIRLPNQPGIRRDH